MACVSTEELLRSNVYEADMTEQEKCFGNYDPGRWGWMLADVELLPKPVPAKGSLSLWDWVDSQGAETPVRHETNRSPHFKKMSAHPILEK
jgi:hypothetical protein